MIQCNLSFFIASCSDGQSLHWRHNRRGSVSNYQPNDCLLNRLFRHRLKKTSKLRVIGLWAGKSPGTGNSQHKWPVTRKMFPFDDVIMFWHATAHTRRWKNTCIMYTCILTKILNKIFMHIPLYMLYWLKIYFMLGGICIHQSICLSVVLIMVGRQSVPNHYSESSSCINHRTTEPLRAHEIWNSIGGQPRTHIFEKVPSIVFVADIASRLNYFGGRILAQQTLGTWFNSE